MRKMNNIKDAIRGQFIKAIYANSTDAQFGKFYTRGKELNF